MLKAALTRKPGESKMDKVTELEPSEEFPILYGLLTSKTDITKPKNRVQLMQLQNQRISPPTIMRRSSHEADSSILNGLLEGDISSSHSLNIFNNSRGSGVGSGGEDGEDSEFSDDESKPSSTTTSRQDEENLRRMLRRSRKEFMIENTSLSPNKRRRLPDLEPIESSPPPRKHPRVQPNDIHQEGPIEVLRTLLNQAKRCRRGGEVVRTELPSRSGAGAGKGRRRLHSSTLACTQCDLTFDLAFLLKRHQELHHPPPPRIQREEGSILARLIQRPLQNQGYKDVEEEEEEEVQNMPLNLKVYKTPAESPSKILKIPNLRGVDIIQISEEESNRETSALNSKPREKSQLQVLIESSSGGGGAAAAEKEGVQKWKNPKNKNQESFTCKNTASER